MVARAAPGNAHFQPYHAHQVQHNVHAAGHGQEHHRSPGVAHSPQDAGTHVVHHGGQRTKEINADVDLGICQAVFRGVHLPQQCRTGENTQRHGGQAQHHGEGHAGVQGIPAPGQIVTAIQLGQQHRGTGAQTNEKTVKQVDQR